MRSQSHGIEVYGSLNNSIYHNNFLSNNGNAIDDGDSTYWDLGPIIGGNYWDTWICHGDPSNDPYQIDPNNVDWHPFEHLEGWKYP
jgi:hypothetical protein